MTIEQRAFKGTMINALAFAVTMLQTIVVVPFLLRAWGGATYGTWIALQAFVALATTAHLGHAENIGNECQKLVSTRAPIDAVFASGVAVALGLGIVEWSATLGLAVTGMVPRALGLSLGASGYSTVAFAAVALVGVSGLVSAPNGIFLRLFLPHGMYVRSQVWGILVGGAGIVAMIVAAALGLGVLGAAVMVALSTLLLQVGSTVDASRTLGIRRRTFRSADFRTGLHGLWRSLVRTGSTYLGQVHLSGLNLALAPALGPSGLAAFATTRTLANAMIQGATLVTVPLLPEVIRFRATNDWRRLEATLRGMWFVGGAIINFCVVSSLPVVVVGYHFWTHRVFALDRPVFSLLALSVCVRTAGAPMARYLEGTNRLRYMALSGVAQASSTIGVGVATVGMLGVRGAALAVLSGEVCGSLIAPAYEYARDRRDAGQSSAGADLWYGAGSLVVIACVLALFSLGALSPWVLTPCAYVALGAMHTWQWRHLPEEVKSRIRGLLEQRLATRRRLPPK